MKKIVYMKSWIIRFLLLVVLLFLSISKSINAVIDDTYFHWTLDNSDTSGTICYDELGNLNRSCTLVGGVVSGQTGKFNQAYYFDGSDDWLEGNFTNYGNDISCFLWIKANASDIGGGEGLIHKDNYYVNANYRDFWFISDISGTTDKIQLYWWLTNGTLLNKLSDSAVSLTSFSLIGFTFDGDLGNLTFYQNTSSIGSSLNTKGKIRDTYPRINVFRTQDPVETTRWLKGLAEEVNCYNRTLSNSDISDLYAIGNPHLCNSDFSNVTYTSWYNITSCTIYDTIYQTRNYTRFDLNACLSNATITENYNNSCDYCSNSNISICNKDLNTNVDSILADNMLIGIVLLYIVLISLGVYLISKGNTTIGLIILSCSIGFDFYFTYSIIETNVIPYLSVNKWYGIFLWVFGFSMFVYSLAKITLPLFIKFKKVN